ncbi:hypothetical protein GF337_13070 [candidate division KSB1 bacterium]|nr:hypothetical protein [candidate division KSB1 bacterium]
MAMNLGRFVAEKDVQSRRNFRELRGTEAYCDFIRDIEFDNLFTKSNEKIANSDSWIEKQGYETGIFQKQLLENWFFPTYELDKNAALSKIEPQLSESQQFQKEWLLWDSYKVRLTRNGFIMIKLIREFSEQNMLELSVHLLEPERDEFRAKLAQTFDNLSESQRKQIAHILHHPLQWQLAYQVIRLFILQLRNIEFGNGQTVEFKMPEEERKMPIRHQYSVILFTEIYDSADASKKKLDGSRILSEKKYARELYALWDGTLIGNREEKSIEFPDYSDEMIQKLKSKNESTWIQEFCLIGFERALIYCPMTEDSLYLPFKGENAKDGILYINHWHCIIRGIEHIIALRSELHMVGAYTGEEMNRLPSFTQELTTRGISHKEKKGVERLARRVANLFNILTSIKEVLVAPSAYRASYAIQKFERLTNLLGLDKIQQHVEKNIDELNFFISHYNKMSIQQNSERLQKLAIIFGIWIGFLGLASLLKDAKELNGFLEPQGFSSALSKLWDFITHFPMLQSLFIIWVIFAVSFYVLWKLYTYFSE